MVPVTGSPAGGLRVLSRWFVAVVVFLGLFVGCWLVWEAFRFPPAGADRLAVALAVAAAISAASSGPLFWWAAREKPGAGTAGQAAAQIIVAPGGPVFGPGSDFRGADLQFVKQAPGLVRAAEGQVVVGDIPREPPAFVAREELGKLAEAVGRGKVAVVCAVTGLRGVGKTQLAAAHARARIREGWCLVAWVNAHAQDTLVAGLARIADRLGVGDPQGDSLESARRLREYLDSQAGERLLVFDDAADPDALRPFIPAAGSVQVVITSTDLAFATFGVAVEVAAFGRAESLGYLRERTGLLDEPGADMVADELGDLPLGLAQAAATIVGQHLTYPAYLERLRGVPVRELLGRVPGSDYPRSAAEALLLSIDTSESGDPAGLTGRVLRVMAVLSPDGVSRALLTGLAPKSGQGAGKAGLDAAVERCVTGSLLTWSVTGDQLIMHPLVGRVVRERDKASRRSRKTVNTALRLLEPLLFDGEQAWARREYGAHLVAQIEALWDASIGDLVSGRSGLRLARRFQARAGAWALRQLRARTWGVRQLAAAADLSRAIGLGTRVLADCEWVLGAGHPQTVSARSVLASAYESAGRLDEAIPLYGRALTDTLRAPLGAGTRHRLAAQNNLAAAYKEAGRFSEAIRLYQRALAGSARWLGASHPLTLTVTNNLAAAYQAAGWHDGAIALSARALADRERVLGADHPDALTSRNNLAASYESAGRLDDAIPLLEQTLADSQRVLGADHPDTIVTRNNLAGAYESAGRLDEAIPLYEQTLADSQRVLGADHPYTLNLRNNMAGAYQSAGRLDEAIALFEQALADTERALGADHLNTLNMRGNLARAYQSAGRLDEAIALFEQAVAGCERALGTQHRYTLILQNYLDRARNEAGTR